MERTFPSLKKFNRVCRSNDKFILVSPPDARTYINKISAIILSMCNGFYSQHEIFNALEKLLGKQLSPNLSSIFFKKFRKYLNINKMRQRPPENWKTLFHSLFDFDKFIPISLMIIPSENCQLSCSYCIRQRMDKNFHWPQKLFEKILKECSEFPVYKINIGGGEPLLLKGISSFITKCVDNDIFVTLSTNACFKNVALIEKIINTGISHIQVSLDATTEDLFCRITRSKGIDYVKRNIEKLVSAGIDVRIRTVLTEENAVEVPTLIRYSKALGIKEHTITPDGRILSDFSNENTQSRRKLIALSKKIEGLDELHVVVDYCEFWNDRSEGDACPGLFSSLAIFPNGDISPCELTPDIIYGNFHHTKIIDAFNSKEANNIRQKVGGGSKTNIKCRKCSHLHNCATGCFAFKDPGLGRYEPDPRCVC